MKTIDERAEKYGIESANLLCSDGWSEEQRQKQAKVYAKVYSKIATEQKTIDIDKAWQFIETTIIREGHAAEDFVEEMNWRFKQAMEE